MPANLSASDALARLVEGNQRFCSNVVSIDTLARQLRRDTFAKEQQPFAIVLGCSDSRAPAELVFDAGLGELFVIRVAGNVVSPSQIGSVEFAAERFGCRLVVVMGHTHCGAIDATLDAVEGKLPPSTNLLSIVQRVRPAVETVREASAGAPREAIARNAVRANVRISAEHLRHGSPLLEALIQRDGLVVACAEYDVETGRVAFFEA